MSPRPTIEVNDADGTLAETLGVAPTPYLAHLTTLALEDLAAEPSALQTQAHHLTSSLTSLTHTSYPTFLSLHATTTELSTSLDALDKSLDALVSNSLPALQATATAWPMRTGPVLAARRKARVVLEQHDKLRDLLDVPILIDTCVRNGFFAEALALAAHADAAASATTPTPPLLDSLRAEVRASTAQMRLTLLATLHESGRKLPALWKAVGFLRRMDAFEDGPVPAELQLALAFLHGRGACLRAALAAPAREVPSLLARLASATTPATEREQEDVARYLKAYIDAWRENVADTLTQYSAIFLAPPSSTSSSTSSSTPAPAPTTPNPALRPLLTTYATHALNTLLLPTLSTALPHAPSAHPALLTQLTYCATALARAGLDFRGALSGVFARAASASTSRALIATVVEWEARIPSGPRAKRASQWLGTPAPVPAPPTGPVHVPPPALTTCPPLAALTNALLTRLNALRLFAPLAAAPAITAALDSALARSTDAFLVYARKTRAASGASTAADAAAAQGAGKLFVHVLVPYVRRALAESVYAGEVKEPSTELARVLGEWETWLGQGEGAGG